MVRIEEEVRQKSEMMVLQLHVILKKERNRWEKE